ncbi:MAG: SH3 domain-containing protein [Acidobacteria bacterium]|nr:SH3 domain-containing protein [Acidobacteriota bacterium]
MKHEKRLDWKIETLRFLCVLCASAVLFALAIGLPLAQEAQKAQVSEDGTTLRLGNRVLLTNEKDGFMSVHQVRHSPDGKRFLVIACGFECNDNIGFVFNADGSGKRKFTARWDFILQDKIEWAADGQTIFYFRVNSSGADSPRNAPAEGWIEMNVATGRKSAARSRTLKPDAKYAVFRLPANDSLNVRQTPGVKAKSIGNLAYDASGIRVTGEQRKVGQDIWVRISYNNLAGWVNQSFLYEKH